MKVYIIYYKDENGNDLKGKFKGVDEAHASRYLTQFWGYDIHHIVDENDPQPEDELNYIWNSGTEEIY